MTRPDLAQRRRQLTISRIAVVFGVVMLTLFVVGCSNVAFLFANAPTAFGTYNRRTDLPYGEDSRQRLDVYSPREARNRPVVIFWYGGSWTGGDKANYRLYPAVAFPAFCEDGAHALAWVEAHAQEFGGDPHRIVLMGHSAGAHMAALIAYNHAFVAQAGADPKSVVGFVGLS